MSRPLIVDIETHYVNTENNDSRQSTTQLLFPSNKRYQKLITFLFVIAVASGVTQSSSVNQFSSTVAVNEVRLSVRDADAQYNHHNSSTGLLHTRNRSQHLQPKLLHQEQQQLRKDENFLHTLAPKQAQPPQPPPQLQKDAATALTTNTKSANTKNNNKQNTNNDDSWPNPAALKLFSQEFRTVKIKLPNITRNIAFIHVGKTGGTAITKAALTHMGCANMPRKKREKCHQHEQMYDTPLRTAASSMEVHLFYKRGQARKIQQKMTTLMFSVRNPVDRVISAYNFVHYNNRRNSVFAADKNPDKDQWCITCFPRLEDLLHTLDSAFKRVTTANSATSQSTTFTHTKNVTSTSAVSLTACQKLALQVLQARVPKTRWINVHLWFNYAHYVRESLDQNPDKEVFVIRMNYMWDDLIKLDKAMGGTGKFKNAGHVFRPNIKTNTKSTKNHDVAISLRHYQQLCCVLHHEIAIYQRIVVKAANLNGPEKLSELREVMELCAVGVPKPGNMPFAWEKWHNTNCPNFEPFLVGVGEE